MADVGIAGARPGRSAARGLPGPAWAPVGSTSAGRSPAAGAGGRSINLRFGTQASTRSSGRLSATVLAHGLAMRGRMMHDRDGRLTYQAYSADGSKAINSISRHGLNALLLDAAESEPRRGRLTSSGAGAVAADAGRITLEAPDGVREVGHDVVIGADGAHSALARPSCAASGPTTTRSTCRGGTRS